MDKNMLKALAACLVVFFVFQTLGFLGTTEWVPIETTTVPGQAPAQPFPGSRVDPLPSPLQAVTAPEDPDHPAEEVTHVIHTAAADYTFSNLGGGLRRIDFKNYGDSVTFTMDRSLPLSLLRIGGADQLQRHSFQAETLEGGSGMHYSLDLPGGLNVRHTLQTTAQDYLLETRLRIENRGTDEVFIHEGLTIGLGELSMQENHPFKTLTFDRLTIDEQTERKPYNKVKGREKKSEPYFWAGIQNNTYCALIREDDFLQQTLWFHEADTESIQAAVGTDAFSLKPGEVRTFHFYYYFGPKLYFHLRDLGLRFEEIIDYGAILGPLTKGLVLLLNFLKDLTGNYGMAIILMTLLFKLVTYPLTRKSIVSMQGMQEISPKMKQLQEQHKNDPKLMQAELLKLYKKHGVNPVSGCLPILIQLPIFIAFYKALANSVELQGASFLFIRDLARPDELIAMGGMTINILPLIMGFTQLISQKQSMTSVNDPNQKFMMYGMTVMFLVIFYKFPSGLVLYWLVSNLIGIAQASWIKRKVSSRAITAEGGA